MRMFFLVGLVLTFPVFSGCVRQQEPSGGTKAVSGSVASTGTNSPADDQKLIITPATGLNGKVSWVDSNLKFVVLTFPVGEIPALNLRLYVYRTGLKTGELTVTGPQNDDSIVADVTAGEAEVGDEVRDK